MCRSQDKVTLEARVDNLNDDVLICETNHKAILGCVTKSAIQEPLLAFMDNDLLLVFCLRH